MVEIFAIESTSSVLEVRVVLVEILRKKDTLKLESDNHCVDLSSTNCAPPQGSDSAIVGKDMLFCNLFIDYFESSCYIVLDLTISFFDLLF